MTKRISFVLSISQFYKPGNSNDGNQAPMFLPSYKCCSRQYMSWSSGASCGGGVCGQPSGPIIDLHDNRAHLLVYSIAPLSRQHSPDDQVVALAAHSPKSQCLLMHHNQPTPGKTVLHEITNQILNGFLLNHGAVAPSEPRSVPNFCMRL